MRPLKMDLPRKLRWLLLLVWMSPVSLLVWGASQQPGPTFQVETEVVSVPVVVVDEDGNLYTDLSEEAFTVLEDGVRQEIVSFDGEESPLTLTMLLEYSRIVAPLRGEVIRPAGIFVTQILESEDWAAIVAFDRRPEILSDFTRNRQRLLDAINTLIYSPPAFSESSLFDALKFTLVGGVLEDYDYKGISAVEGRTGVLLVATGLDTLGSVNFDEMRRIVANAGVPVYSIGIGEMSFIRQEAYLSGSQRMTFLQAQNVLRTLSEESGGRFYSPRFPAAVNDVLESIAAMMRFQYTLGYVPSNKRREGKKREIEVLVDIDGDGETDDENLDLNHRQYYHEGDED